MIMNFYKKKKEKRHVQELNEESFFQQVVITF